MVKKPISLSNILLRSHFNLHCTLVCLVGCLLFFNYAPQEISTAYRGVADAFPDEKRQSLVLGKRAYRGRPDPTFSLKCNKVVIAFDGRIDVRIRSGEKLNLSNRSRGYNLSGINKVQLPVPEPTSEDDVGGVILVSFRKDHKP